MSEIKSTLPAKIGGAEITRFNAAGAVTGTWLWPNEISRARLEFRQPSLPANFGTLRL